MFDRANTPTELSQEVIDGINAAIERFRAMRVASISVSGPKNGTWYCNLINVYTQAHIRRLLTCLDAGYVEFSAGRYLITDMCSRAIYESLAVYRDFVRQLGRLVDAKDTAKIEEFLRKRILATRVEEFTAGDSAVSATNVLGLVAKLKKEIPTAPEAYDHLSDIAHPNVLGSVVYFSKMNPDEEVFTFPDETSSKDRARDSFAVAAVLLLHFDLAVQELEPMLKKLAEGGSA